MRTSLADRRPGSGAGVSAGLQTRRTDVCPAVRCSSALRPHLSGHPLPCPVRRTGPGGTPGRTTRDDIAPLGNVTARRRRVFHGCAAGARKAVLWPTGCGETQQINQIP